MSENKELHEENLNKEGQENLQNEQNTTESVTEQPTAYRDWETDRKSTRLNSSHSGESRMPSSA